VTSAETGAWTTGSNRPGYLPEGDVHAFAEWSDAADVLRSDMREWADTVDDMAREHLDQTAKREDYPDYENSGYGDDEPTTLANVQALLTDDGPADGKPWLAYVSDPDGHQMAWWIQWSPDATPDDNE
jgi:hypothetical protein